jgi:A/G-specific adenine glycosylase
MKRLSTVTALAEAPQQEVLNLWEGLGYYSRARNLHRSAQIVVDKFNGEIPQDIESLTSLPGIGRYTAAAIASIAFGRDEPALDGNIRRVMSRVFNIRDPARSPSGERKLWELAAEHLPSGRAGEFNQAVMDLGAAICTPKEPNCPICPVEKICEAKKLGVQADRPVRKPKAATPHHTVTAAVIQQDGNVMIVQRPQDGLLGGLWEFPGGKREPGEELTACLRREINEELGIEIKVGAPFGVYKHAYTHFRVTLHAYLCELNGEQPQLKEHRDLRWVKPPDLEDFPMGKIDRQIANKLSQTSPKAA